MAYYFKPANHKKERQRHSLSPPSEGQNSDFHVLLPYLIALQLPICFRFITDEQQLETTNCIQSFDHTGLTLSNHKFVLINDIAAIILSFKDTTSRQQYANAFANWLSLYTRHCHKQKIMFEYLRTNKYKISSLSLHHHEIFSSRSYKTIHYVGNSTIFVTYEENRLFYLEIISLFAITSYETSYI